MAHSVSRSKVRRYLASPIQHVVRPSLLALMMLLLVPYGALAQSIDTLITWNRVLLNAITTPGEQPPTVFFTRSPALVSAAGSSGQQLRPAVSAGIQHASTSRPVPRAMPQWPRRPTMRWRR